ncbi:hypothetical protein NITGR_130046 [Nitrospina gracilis 3/211]|uniref:Uncharacterized protein n=1 Tax=Nitrospina gracilis (strain 3/211) TaxID=1266370 RepID=M1Z8Z9_NITG3|nr:hypothetical protein NITGR_130046 [Nitrospina gracilis 3/211]
MWKLLYNGFFVSAVMEMPFAGSTDPPIHEFEDVHFKHTQLSRPGASQKMRAGEEYRRKPGGAFQ